MAAEAWQDGPPEGWDDDREYDDTDAPSGARRAPQSAKLADILVQVINSQAELFHDPKRVAYARVKVGARSAVLKVRARGFRTWVAYAARAFGAIKAAALDEAITTIEGVALHDREEREVFLRIAEADGKVYVDLGDALGRCAEITSKGWTVLDAAPVMFRRPDAMRPLPIPERGGSIEELRPFINVDDDGFVLFVAWIVAAYRLGRAYAILALYGEQGTAKSTTSRCGRALVDPNVVPVRSPPKCEDDLIVAASHSHVVAFDNLSGVMPWLSDALCRLATGGGLTKRALYTDDDEVAIEVLRPVIVNGIDEIANRADLAERCIVLELQPLAKGRRKSERAFREAFDAAAPRILGAVFDGVAAALENLSSVDDTDLPRMADFAMWSAAAERGMGFAAGSFAAAYDRNRKRAVDLALQASPVAVALRTLLEKPSNAGVWEGQPEQLLSCLNELTAEPTRRMPSWPKNAASLSRSLRRAATFLRTIGVEVDLDGKAGRDSDRARQWRVTNTRGRDGVAMGTRSEDSRSPEKTASGDEGDAGDETFPTHCFSELLT
jgi:hypothetical protein